MIEWIVNVSILIAVIITLRYLLKGKINLRIQYALWALVLLRLLIPFSIGSSSLSVMNTAKGIPVVQDVESVRGVGNIWHTEIGSVEGYPSYELMPDTPVTVAEGKTEAEFARMERTLAFREAFVTIWLCGAAILFAAFTVSNGRFASRLHRTRKPLEVKGSALPVYITRETDTPCLFGLFRPAIYVTPEAAEDAAILRHTVEHETTHFRHGDNFWSVLRGVCLALHWYNPLVWWAAFLSRNDAELACDESTIRRIGENERAAYGRTLIGMTCQKRTALLITATTMTGSKRSIKERITLIAKKPRMAVYTLISVILIVAIAVGCTFTGAKDGSPSVDEDYTLYDCGGLTVAVPNEHLDQLIIHSGDELDNNTALISVYEKASVEAATADGLDDSGFGWLFSILRYDRAQYEQYLCADGSGLSFFAKDDKWYYGYCTATDVRFYRSGDGDFDEAGLAQWSALNDRMGPSVRDDFIERNDLTSYSDNEARSGYTYDGAHQFLNYYPYYSVNGSKDEVYVLVLSQPAKQGEGGIWCVERMLDSAGYAYLWFPDSGKPASAYYAELQTEVDAGHKADLLDIEAVAIAFLNESRYFDSPMIDGSLVPASDPTAGTTLNVLTAMRDVKTSDFTNSDYYGNVTADQLAQALNAAAADQIDAADAVSAGYLEGVYPYWSIGDAYLEGGPDSWSSTDLHFRIDCGLTENIVEVSIRKANQRDTAYFEDEDLYRLVQHHGDYDEVVDEVAFETFKDILVPQMDKIYARMSDNPGNFTGYQLTRFALAWSYDNPDDGSFVELYYFDYALLTDDPATVGWAGGMYLDSKLRVQGFNGGGQFAVKYSEGEIVTTVLMGNDFYYSPVYVDDAEWAMERLNSALNLAENNAG